MKTCQFCAEPDLQDEAKVCKHCGKGVLDIKNEDAIKDAAIRRFTTWDYMTFLVLFALGIYRCLEGSLWFGFVMFGAAAIFREFRISKYKKQFVDEIIQRPIVEQAAGIPDGTHQATFRKESSYFENAYGQSIGSPPRDRTPNEITDKV